MSTTKPIAESGWTNRFTSAIGYYFVRERGEDPADASIIEYQGGERAYISGADDNFYKEWASGRYEFLGPFTASDFEQLLRLRKAAQAALPPLRYLVQHGHVPDDLISATNDVIAALREALVQRATGE